MTELADRLSRHADLHEHQPWADDEQMQFARDLREAVGLIAELARLRAQEPVAYCNGDALLSFKCGNELPLKLSETRDGFYKTPLYRDAPPAQPADEVEERAQFGAWCGDRGYYETPEAWAEYRRFKATPAQPAMSDPVTLSDVLDALNVFNKPRPSEGGEPWTEADFISVKHLPDFINIIAVAWFSRTQPAEPVQRMSDAGIEALAGKHVGNSKLTRVDVISARRLRAKGETFQSIADRFSVDIKTIMAAIKGKQWSHVIDPAAPKATK